MGHGESAREETDGVDKIHRALSCNMTRSVVEVFGGEWEGGL